MPGELLEAGSIVVAALASLTVLHVGYLACTRTQRTPTSWRTSAVLLAGLVVAGSLLVWARLASISLSVKVGAVCLFLAGCLCYLELRSLLSRGYSFRILLDLMSREEGATLAHLQSGYGNGVGVRGLLARRLKTLARLRLLHLRGNQAGPLTPLGALVAVTGSLMRRALRMERVG